MILNFRKVLLNKLASRLFTSKHVIIFIRFNKPDKFVIGLTVLVVFFHGIIHIQHFSISKMCRFILKDSCWNTIIQDILLNVQG